MHHRRVAVLVSVALLLTACTDVVAGDASPGGPASRSTPPPGSTPSPAPGTPAPTDEQPPPGPDFPADTEADGGPAQAGADDDPAGSMRVQGLRYTTENGYVRLVVDLSTSGVPEWTIGYSEPSGPGGGPVEIAGDAFLRLQLRTQATPAGQGSSQITVSPGPVVEARTTGFFEGTEEVLIGIRGGEQPFRAFALTDPGRIVLDVRSAG